MQNKNFAEDIFQQAANISKAHAHDILVDQVKELKQENTELKIKLKGAQDQIKLLKDFIDSIRPSKFFS